MFQVRKNSTQRELGEKCGSATGTIQQYELGKRRPRIEQLTKIAGVLDVTIEELIGWDVNISINENILNTPYVANMLGDTIKKSFDDKIFKISFNTNDYTPEQLLKILEYAEFIKSRNEKK